MLNCTNEFYLKALEIFDRNFVSLNDPDASNFNTNHLLT